MLQFPQESYTSLVAGATGAAAAAAAAVDFPFPAAADAAATASVVSAAVTAAALTSGTRGGGDFSPFIKSSESANCSAVPGSIRPAARIFSLSSFVTIFSSSKASRYRSRGSS